VPRLTADARRHAVKFAESFIVGNQLAEFWGDYDAIELPEDDSPEGWNAWSAKNSADAAAAGRRANDEKMAGFYVDLDDSGSAVHSPTEIEPGTISADLQTAAQVIEMLLIKDHSRMKLDAQTPYDSTHEQQHRLLPISHPDEWHDASDEFKRGDYSASSDG
jgi:AbiV family abortive infection protein